MWRSDLEDRYTVECKKCGHKSLDTNKKPGQRYSKETCPSCGYIHSHPKLPPGLKELDRSKE